MQYMFKFNVQIFTGVQCGLLVSRGNAPPVSCFVPDPINHVHIYGRNRFVCRACSSSRLAGRSGTKTLPLTYPHTENPGVLKSGDRGGQAIVTPRPIQATVCRVTRGNHRAESTKHTLIQARLAR